jgi:tetratricopeptide (TPR) repeat protein
MSIGPWFLRVLILIVFLFGTGSSTGFSELEEAAYEHNRAGMANMSMARFEEAITEFEKAAALASDYQIRGRSLIYTPIFMTAWAYEKLGRLHEACKYYREFLTVAPTEMVEETKADHARAFLADC